MEMRDDERGGEKLEAEDAVLGGFLEIGGDEGVVAALPEGFVNFLQDFNEVGARPTARVKNVNIFVSEAVGNVEFLAEDSVYAGDHVLDDFWRRVPDAELLAELGIEGLKKRFIEILDGVCLLKIGEERSAVHTAKDGSCPIQDFREIEFLKLAGVGDFMEELAENGNAEVVCGKPPVEALLAGGRVFLGPENPGGEHTIKERLNKRGAEKVFAFFTLEGKAQGLFQRFPNRGQGGEFAKADACERVASVGSKEPGDRFGRGDGGSMKQGALGKLDKHGTVLTYGFLGMSGAGPKLLFGISEAVAFELYRFSRGILTDENEISVVCNQDLTILAPISADLFAVGGYPGVV